MQPDSDIQKTLDVLGADHRGMRQLLLGLLDSMSKRQQLLDGLDDEPTGSPLPGRHPDGPEKDYPGR